MKNFGLKLLNSIYFHSKASLLSPLPLRIYWTQILMKKLKLGSFKQRLDIDAINYPGYAYGMYSAALQAKALGLKKITAIEFGVASGNGLIAIENHATEIFNMIGIEFDIYGFDTGQGLPKPTDYKDQSYFWNEKKFVMDQIKLEKSLTISKLVIGDIKFTLNNFTKNILNFPIGFIAFDLDYYSSTTTSFDIFKIDDKFLLPRVECYMDDVGSTELLVASEETGVLKAINDFNNESSETKKILKKKGLSQFRTIPSFWNEKIYVFHSFKHLKYNQSLNA